MNKKTLFFTFFILSLMLVPSALANDSPFEKIGEVFAGISEFGALGWLDNNFKGDNQLIGFLRILIGIIIYSLIYMAIRMVNDKVSNLEIPKGTAVTISVVLAIISVIFMPSVVITTIGASYGAAAAFVLIGSLLGSFLYLLYGTDTQSSVMALSKLGGVFFVGWLLVAIGNKISDYGGQVGLTQFGNWFDWLSNYVFLILVFTGIWFLVKSFTLRKGSSGSDPLSQITGFGSSGGRSHSSHSLPSDPIDPKDPKIPRKSGIPSGGAKGNKDKGPVKPEKKKDIESLTKKLYRVLRRVYRYHRKVCGNFTSILKLVKKSEWEKVKKKVETAIKYESKEVKYNALEEDIAKKIFEEVEQVHKNHPNVNDNDSKKLNLFRNQLLKDLDDYSKGIKGFKKGVEKIIENPPEKGESQDIAVRANMEVELDKLKSLSKKIKEDILDLEIEDKKLQHEEFMK